MEAKPTLSFTDLYHHYAKLVRAKLTRSDISPPSADELLDDVFTTLNAEIRQDKIPWNPVAMIRAITRNAVRNDRRIRRRRARFDGAVDVEALPVSSRASVERRMDDEARKQLFRTLLYRLPEEDRELIRRIDLDEMTHKEVAARDGLPVGTVKTRHRNAREQLRKLAQRPYMADMARAPGRDRSPPLMPPSRRAG